MYIPSGNYTSKKIANKSTRKEFNKSPLKSSIPIQLIEFIKNHNLNQITPEAAQKNSYKEDSSPKKYSLNNMTNNNIPEVSEKSSDNKKEKNKKEKKKKSKKKGRGDNNYYIHYIKNVYENEAHLNKENLLNNISNKINNEKDSKIIESNKKSRYWRRNSALNENLFKCNFHNNNLIIDKEQIDKRKSGSIIDKIKIENLGSFFHKKLLEKKEKKISKLNNNKNKTRHKNKDKSKNKNNDEKISDKEKDLNKDNIKNIKKKEIFENEKKTDIENKSESIKIQKTSIFKKVFFCCFINNGDSSLEKV